MDELISNEDAQKIKEYLDMVNRCIDIWESMEIEFDTLMQKIKEFEQNYPELIKIINELEDS